MNVMLDLDIRNPDLDELFGLRRMLLIMLAGGFTDTQFSSRGGQITAKQESIPIGPEIASGIAEVFHSNSLLNLKSERSVNVVEGRIGDSLATIEIDFSGGEDGEVLLRIKAPESAFDEAKAVQAEICKIADPCIVALHNNTSALFSKRDGIRMRRARLVSKGVLFIVAVTVLVSLIVRLTC